MRARISDEIKQRAVDAYAKCGVLAIVAKEVGVSRTTLWAESKRNLAFRDALEEARATYCDILESILNKRIMDGSKDKMSGLLLMFKLKAEMPNKYRERIDHKIEGDVKIISGVPRPKEKRD